MNLNVYREDKTKRFPDYGNIEAVSQMCLEKPKLLQDCNWNNSRIASFLFLGGSDGRESPAVYSQIIIIVVTFMYFSLV